MSTICRAGIAGLGGGDGIEITTKRFTFCSNFCWNTTIIAIIAIIELAWFVGFCDCSISNWSSAVLQVACRSNIKQNPNHLHVQYLAMVAFLRAFAPASVQDILLGEFGVDQWTFFFRKT